MNRIALATLAPLLLAGPALSAGCNAGSPDTFTVLGWSAQPWPAGNGAVVTVSFNNNTGKILVGAEASALFFDSSDTAIGQFELPVDLSLPPTGLGSATVEAGSLGPLISAASDKVKALICVRKLVFEDGSSQQF